MKNDMFGSILCMSLVAVFAVVFILLSALLTATKHEIIDKTYAAAVADYGIETASVNDFLSMCKHDEEMQKCMKAIWLFIPDEVRSAYDKDHSKTLLIIADWLLMQYAKHKSEDKQILLFTAESGYAKAVYRLFRRNDCTAVGFDAKYDEKQRELNIIVHAKYNDGHLEDNVLVVYSATASEKAKAWTAAHVEEAARSPEFKAIVLEAVRK